ncbi:MAG: ISAzo13 family transposase, partial [Burkholderiaceae bacterium]|nr:ISAzo13 family transposase [Burkholderiaceae bacterium]
MDAAQAIAAKYRALSGRLDEATLRLWAAAEARSLGHGGISTVARAVGVSRTTIHAGLAEIDAAASQVPAPAPERSRRIRAAGGGRKKLTDLDSGLLAALDALVEPASRGDPVSPLRWSCKSTFRLAQELHAMGHAVSQRSVCDLLARLGYSLQSVRNTREGSPHADRDAQFHHIAQAVEQWQALKQPVISVGTRKKELIGDFKHAGRERHPKGQSQGVRGHDFVDPELGKINPHGEYDLTASQGWVSVGIDHGTAEFAVQSIRRWWLEMGRPLYPQARQLLITAHCGGGNGYRIGPWRQQLQCLADELGLGVQVCHFPPGT